MTLTLKESIDHARLIKQIDCKICGKTLFIESSLVSLVSTIRNNGYCPQCQIVLNYVETHGGKLPTIDETLK